MKNTFKLFGIIAMTVIMGFSFVSCGGTSSPADPSPARTPIPPPAATPPAPLTSLTIGGEVDYRSFWTGSPWLSNTSVTSLSGAVNGNITDGNVSITLPNTPSAPFPISYFREFMLTEGLTNVHVYPNVEIYYFYLLRTTPHIMRHDEKLLHEWHRRGIGGTDYWDRVWYVWVSGDATMTAYGFEMPGFRIEGINVTLQAGWNTMIHRRRAGLIETYSFFTAPPAPQNFQWFLRVY